MGATAAAIEVRGPRVVAAELRKLAASIEQSAERIAAAMRGFAN